jgi:hypothetical protein
LPYAIDLIALVPKFEVTVVQVVALVEVRIVPAFPPATQRLLPKAMESICGVPKFEVTVTHVVALVEVRI